MNAFRYTNRVAFLARAVLAATLPSAQAIAAAPSFTLFGAFFPAWMLCALIGVVAALIGRALLMAFKLHTVLPFQLFVCTACGVIVAMLVWLVWFGS
ncbi:hypothetical protein KSF73_07145 [Burkholderiaceae bacterium DAT-1]|nr:hypothetical protein [Burkholderiaceae bacterium DAT-1]